MIANTPMAPLPPMHERCLIGRMDHWRAERPDQPAVLMPAHGVTFTYGELWTDVARTAAGVRALGLERGDRVAIMLRNRPETLLMWLGCEYAGIIPVSMDPDSTGRILAHLLTVTSPRLAVCDDISTVLVDAVAGDAPSVQWLLNVDGRARPSTPSLTAIAPGDLDTGEIAPDPLDVRDTRAIRFTSGTTGPAKAVGFTESQMAVLATEYLWLGRSDGSDRLYTPFPLYHALASCNGVGAMLRVGGSAVLDDRFRASEFWQRVGRTDATVAQLIRALMGTLLLQPERPSDRDHRCQRAQWCHPDERFARRFGVTLYGAYGMSEATFLAYTPPGAPPPPEGAVGRLSPLHDIRIVDEDDVEVPVGTAGEVVCRPRFPHTTSSGYFGDAPATVRAWRNLWYHTGDQGCLGADGYLRLLGRMGDQIRRKGVNIAAESIELAAQEHPSVALAAAIAVPSPLGESEVKLCVEHNGVSPDLMPFVDFLRERLPPVMLPRYVEFRASLPMSPGNKVRKVALREEGDHGITPATVDVESLTKGTRRL